MVTANGEEQLKHLKAIANGQVQVHEIECLPTSAGISCRSSRFVCECEGTKKRKRLKQKSSKQIEAEKPIKHRVPKGTAYGQAHATDEESETSEEESSYSEESD